MTTQLVLGPVVFSDFEIPEHLQIGGTQRLVIHSLPGGGRVVDAMGAEDKPIGWSGVFSGQSAADRVRLLERLCRGGLRQTLAWDAWRYTVIVQEFEASVTSNWWIPYNIKLCVIRDSGRLDWLATATPPPVSVELLTAVGLQSAIGIAGLGLGADSLGQTIAAAGDLAQYVTARAYGLIAS